MAMKQQDLCKIFQVLQKLSRSCMTRQVVSSFISQCIAYLAFQSLQHCILSFLLQHCVVSVFGTPHQHLLPNSVMTRVATPLLGSQKSLLVSSCFVGVAVLVVVGGRGDGVRGGEGFWARVDTVERVE